jgi:hypothetical protein
MASQQSQGDHDDEQHRKFREALERKQAQHHARAESAENTGKSEAHNDKHQRQFRRKAGS